jgi:glycine/D-amino acid oxidase-like deaminating enzyme
MGEALEREREREWRWRWAAAQNFRWVRSKWRNQALNTTEAVEGGRTSQRERERGESTCRGVERWSVTEHVVCIKRIGRSFEVFEVGHWKLNCSNDSAHASFRNKAALARPIRV